MPYQSLYPRLPLPTTGYRRCASDTEHRGTQHTVFTLLCVNPFAVQWSPARTSCRFCWCLARLSFLDVRLCDLVLQLMHWTPAHRTVTLVCRGIYHIHICTISVAMRLCASARLSHLLSAHLAYVSSVGFVFARTCVCAHKCYIQPSQRILYTLYNHSAWW